MEIFGIQWELRHITREKVDGKVVCYSIFGKTYEEIRQKILNDTHNEKRSKVLERGSTGVSEEIPQKEQMPETMSEDIPEEILLEDILFCDVYEKWLKLKRKEVKISSIQKYMIVYEKHIYPAFGRMHCSDITDNSLDRFMKSITGKDAGDQSDVKIKLSDEYIKNICTILNSILKYGYKSGYMKNLKPLRHKFRRRSAAECTITALSIEEQEVLTDYLMQKPDNRNIGILLCLHTGLQLGEICALTWEDLDTKQGILKVDKILQSIKASAFDNPDESKNKMLLHISKITGSANRVIPVPDFLCRIIEENLTRADGFFLSGDKKPVEPWTYNYYYKRHLKKAGLKQFNFKALRDTFAVQWIDFGLDVTTLNEILGYSNDPVAINRYAVYSLEQVKQNS